MACYLSGYKGRFAPSPTGPLHAGSLVAALASWLDARALAGRWLVRIEDLDTPRCVAGADLTLLAQLADCGLVPDAPPVYQSQRGALYQQALERLNAQGLAYPCACTRQDLARALQARGRPHQRHEELVYPGTCRHGLDGRPPRTWRFLSEEFEGKRPVVQSFNAQAAIKSIATAGSQPTQAKAPGDELTIWHDRALGAQSQHVARDVGDFVLRRADGLFAYQLAVVVDDAAQGVTHIVRGRDLADNTARQILLQRALGLPTPRYLHTPLVMGADGEKLSKQNGAQPIDTTQPVAALARAGEVLGLVAHLAPAPASVPEWLQQAVAQWRVRYPESAH